MSHKPPEAVLTWDEVAAEYERRHPGEQMTNEGARTIWKRAMKKMRTALANDGILSVEDAYEPNTRKH